MHASALALGCVAILSSAAWLIVPHLGYSHDLRHALMLIVLALFPAALNTIQEAVFIAHERVEFQTITTFFSSIVLVIATFSLVKSGHGVISAVIAFVVVEYAITIVYYLIINRYIGRLSFAFRRSVATEIIGEIKAFAGSSLVAGVFARPEILILSLFASTRQVGFYSVALKVVDVLVFVPQVYMTNVSGALAVVRQDGRACATDPGHVHTLSPGTGLPGLRRHLRRGTPDPRHLRFALRTGGAAAEDHGPQLRACECPRPPLARPRRARRAGPDAEDPARHDHGTPGHQGCP